MLQAKKRRWEVAEERRILEEEGLLGKLVNLLAEEGEREVRAVEKEWSLGEMKGVDEEGERGGGEKREWQEGQKEEKEEEHPLDEAVKEEIEARRHGTQEKINLLKDVFARADPAKYKPRVYSLLSIHTSCLHANQHLFVGSRLSQIT